MVIRKYGLKNLPGLSWRRLGPGWGDGGDCALLRGVDGGVSAKASGRELIMRVTMTIKQEAVAKKVMEALLSFAIGNCLSF